jgi:hypothetical protein
MVIQAMIVFPACVINHLTAILFSFAMVAIFKALSIILIICKALVMTALWMTPVIENDMPNRTEHGYAFTNHYKIDPRLGGQKLIKN